MGRVVVYVYRQKGDQVAVYKYESPQMENKEPNYDRHEELAIQQAVSRGKLKAEEANLAGTKIEYFK